ncbi:MAG: hypothetical protein HUU35_14010, partial [Armatimonadetes bacterium]|nr:hypothetical protein [Armatimonadota bacterium]
MTRATLLALLCLSAAWGAVVEDFEQPGGWVVYQGEQRGGSFEAVAAPAPRGLSGRLSWSVPHHHFLELQRRTALPLPALATALQGELVVQVASGQPEAINGVSLRLVDRDGEVLQFVSRVEKLGTGWQAVSFPLTPQNLRDSWGGTKNGRADPPLRLLGFAVSFTAAATTPGAIYLDDVALLTPGQEIETVRPLWRFDAGERWSVHEKLREVANLEPREGLVLTLSPVAKETGIPVYERGFATTSLAGATAITLRAELLEGSGTRFQLRLRDARGEVHPFATRSLAAGANTLRWSIPGDKATGNTWGQNLDGVLDPPLVLHELYVIQPAGAAPARIRLLEAALHGRKPRLEALSLEVETGNPIHVLKVGEESKLALSLRSEAAEPLTVQARLEYEDFAGAVTGSEQAVTVPAGGTAALRPPDLPAALGIYWINYTLSDAEGNSRRGRTSFCRMAPAGPTPERAEGFLFGICTHTERWPEAQQLKEIMAAGLCGAKVIRTGVGWGGIQPTEERWTWDHMDRLVERYGQQGMELQCLLAFTPQWAAPAEFRQAEYRVWSRKMPRLDAWRTWVTAMARRYGDRIRFWEVWNEPDIGFWLGSLEEYLQLLQTAHDAIKQVDPKLQVMTGGFAIYDRNPQFIEAVVDRGQAWFDIFAYHRHGDFDPFRREVDGPVAAMRARLRPPKPIYFNETAISSLPVGERGQAETLFKKLIYAWSRGSMGYTWYDLRNDGFDPKDWEHNYGMVTNDFYPKAVYPAFNTLVSLLRGHQYQHELALGADRYGFVFASEREQVVATWA